MELFYLPLNVRFSIYKYIYIYIYWVKDYEKQGYALDGVKIAD